MLNMRFLGLAFPSFFLFFSHFDLRDLPVQRSSYLSLGQLSLVCFNNAKALRLWREEGGEGGRSVVR